MLGAFTAAAVVLGLFGAGVFMPVVGLAGLSAKQAVGTFDSLPAAFTASPIAQQSQILGSDGSVIATLYEENRTVVPLSKIAPVMQEAQIAIEDVRFYEHGGVDAKGLARALFSTLLGDKQGASTITQQYVKQTLLNAALRVDDEDLAEAAQARGGVAGIVRKLQEAKYAVALEENISKDQVLEGYLNLVYYGAGAYGVEAASKRYFGVSAAKLTLPQAAMIAGMAQRPGATDPFQNREAALSRRNDVLQRMYETKKITRAQYRKAVRTPIKLKPTRGKASCPASVDPYFCDYVTRWLLDQESLGATPEERRNLIYRGGLKIQTAYDPRLNRDVRKQLSDRVPVGNGQDIGAAAAIVEPGTGKVLALAQNTEYSTSRQKKDGQTSVNWSVDAQYGGSGGFQIGSTAKVFAVVGALEKGMTRNSRIYAPPNGTPYSISRLGGKKCGFEGRSYAPRNAESNEHGNMSLQHATAKSVNTAFVELAARIGLCKEQEVMARMGLHTAQGKPYGQTYASRVILGADNASPLTLASSYATLAAGGKKCEPYPVITITSFDGTDYPVKTGGCQQVVDPKVAYDATRILQTVLAPGGTGRELALGDDRPAAGKTGTADASVHTWFAGYTPQRAAAVWVGHPNAQRPMRGVTLGGRSYGTVYGATIAGPIWQDIMNRSSKGLPVERFARPAGDDAEQSVRVPDVAGRGERSATRVLKEAGLTVEVADERANSDTVDYGRVVRTSPAAGETAEAGDTITVILSSGREPESREDARRDPDRQDGTAARERAAGPSVRDQGTAASAGTDR